MTNESPADPVDQPAVPSPPQQSEAGEVIAKVVEAVVSADREARADAGVGEPCAHRPRAPHEPPNEILTEVVYQ